MSHQKYDVVVVGAGLIGLSTAMNLLERYPKLSVGVVEKGSEVATQQSGHRTYTVPATSLTAPGCTRMWSLA